MQGICALVANNVTGQCQDELAVINNLSHIVTKRKHYHKTNIRNYMVLCQPRRHTPGLVCLSRTLRGTWHLRVMH